MKITKKTQPCSTNHIIYKKVTKKTQPCSTNHIIYKKVTKKTQLCNTNHCRSLLYMLLFNSKIDQKKKKMFGKIFQNAKRNVNVKMLEIQKNNGSSPLFIQYGSVK